MSTENVRWPSKAPINIIVRMPNWLGDAVMATPILADLRTRYPEATITVMCQKGVCPLLQHDPNVNEIFCFQRPSGWIHRTQHYEIIDPLRKGEYDMGILLTNSLSSAWWFWLGRVKNRLGFIGHWRRWLLDKALPFPEEKETQHLVLTYKALLTPLGIPVSLTPPKLYVTDKELDEAKELLGKFGVKQGVHKVVGINPGAAYGSAKCWLPERFEEVTKRLIAEPNTYVVYFGDQAGTPLVDKICESMPDKVINLAGKTSIRELMALIKCCSVILTNDSGPMHIAAALEVPLLALFGSTCDVKTGPYNQGEVIHKHVSCSPCYKRVCPIDFKCMKQIGVDEVTERLIKLMEKNG